MKGEKMKAFWFNYILHSVMAGFCTYVWINAILQKNIVSSIVMPILILFFIGFFVFVLLQHKKVKQTMLWNKYFKEKNFEATKLISKSWHQKRPLMMSKNELALTDIMTYLSVDDIHSATECLPLALQNRVWANKFPSVYYVMLIALDNEEFEKAKELGDYFLEETKSTYASRYFNDMRKSIMFLLGYSQFPIRSEFFPIVDRLVNKKLEQMHGNKEEKDI